MINLYKKKHVFASVFDHQSSNSNSHSYCPCFQNGWRMQHFLFESIFFFKKIFVSFSFAFALTFSPFFPNLPNYLGKNCFLMGSLIYCCFAYRMQCDMTFSSRFYEHLIKDRLSHNNDNCWIALFVTTFIKLLINVRWRLIFHLKTHNKHHFQLKKLFNEEFNLMKFLFSIPSLSSLKF